MADTIITSQTGRQIDKDLKAFLNIMTEAAKTENDGKVLYVRRGNSTFEEGLALFSITPLT